MEAELEEAKEGTEMETETISRKTEMRIVQSVREILKEKNLYELTEGKVREEASVQLDVNLSEEPYKSIVSRTVRDFLEQLMIELKKPKPKRKPKPNASPPKSRRTRKGKF